MKILLANYEYPGVTANCGGGGEVTEQLATALVDRGHTVRVVTDQDDGSHLTFPMRLYRELDRVIRAFKPDVVNAHFSIPTGVPLARLCRKHDVPLVTSVMGADVYDPTRYGRVRPLLDVANDYVCKRSEMVVAPSSDMAARIPSAYQDRSRTIHYGIPPTDFDWQHRELGGTLRVLTLCRLVERKNLPVAIRACERLRAIGYDVEHTIVGKGPLLDDLRERHQSKSWLSLLGYVEDLNAAFATHDVFLLPSEHEAFGMVFLEALASGLPVVTSDTGGQTDIVSEAVGRCVQPDAESVMQGLSDVVDEYRRLQDATQEFVASNFSRAAMAREYELAYYTVL